MIDARAVLTVPLRAGGEVGGKAIGLRRLIDHGFTVPPGFCITTDAYHEHFRTNNLEVQLPEPNPTPSDPALVTRQLAEVRRLILFQPDGGHNRAAVLGQIAQVALVHVPAD